MDEGDFMVVRYAQLNEAGDTVVNIIVADEGLTEWDGLRLVPIENVAVSPAASYSNGVFTPAPPRPDPRAEIKAKAAAANQTPSLQAVLEYLKALYPEDFS